MKMNIEIVERSSGFWIVNGLELIEGPFFTMNEANRFLKQLNNKRSIYKCDDSKIKGVYRRLKAGEIIKEGDFGNAPENRVGDGWISADELVAVGDIVDDDKLYWYRRIHCRKDLVK
jgi:hypothetical protein